MGISPMTVMLEGHGRELETVDVTRTVGWFTAMYPVHIAAESVGSWGDALKAVKEAVRSIPTSGLGYGLLRYCSGDATLAASLAALDTGVAFNYLGRARASSGALLTVSDSTLSSNRSPTTVRSHTLEVDGRIDADSGVLSMNWTFSGNLHAPATIRRLAATYIDGLRSLIAHCSEQEARAYTPSDFPAADLDADDLEELLSELDEQAE